MEGEKHSCQIWVLSAFLRVEIVMCVLRFLSCQQAATTSYPALAYFRAVHRNSTNQDIKKKNNSNYENVHK